MKSSASQLCQNAFSLVELLIAVAVISIIAALVLPALFKDDDGYRALVNRKNAQSIAAIASMARAAGDSTVSASATVQEALQKLTLGVHGRGALENTFLQLSQLGPNEIAAATPLLEISKGTLRLK